jgi:hypothetical protein
MLHHCYSGNRKGILNEADCVHSFYAYMHVIVIGKCQNWHHSRIPLFECIIRKNVKSQRSKNVTAHELYDLDHPYDKLVIYTFVCETKNGIVTSTS